MVTFGQSFSRAFIGSHSYLIEKDLISRKLNIIEMMLLSLVEFGSKTIGYAFMSNENLIKQMKCNDNELYKALNFLKKSNILDIKNFSRGGVTDRRLNLSSNANDILKFCEDEKVNENRFFISISDETLNNFFGNEARIIKNGLVDKKLSSLECLVLSLIISLTSGNDKIKITNKSLAYGIGESEDIIKKTIERLKVKKIISIIKEKGNGREIKVNYSF